MDIDTIQDDVATFTDDLFASSLSIIDNNFDFIDGNELIVPKENYLLVFDFLNITIKHFASLDHEFLSKTLKKLHRDINNLYKLYQTQKTQMGAIEEIFKTRFLKKIELFNQMQKSMTELKNATNLDDEDRETIEIIKNQYKEMRKIYFDTFRDDYMEQSKDIISSLEQILNSKIFYLDKLLWIHAIKSSAIWRSLKMLRIDKDINSKKYLAYRLSVALPYTEEYRYMKKCIRVYK
jgi:hypothetical protein